MTWFLKILSADIAFSVIWKLFSPNCFVNSISGPSYEDRLGISLGSLSIPTKLHTAEIEVGIGMGKPLHSFSAEIHSIRQDMSQKRLISYAGLRLNLEIPQYCI